MADLHYQRLTRSKLRSRFALAITSRSSLWLGPDHLLVVDTTGYNESYKRFFFRDIQAVTLTLTRRRLVWNWVLGALTAASLAGWGFYFASNPALDLALVLLALGTVALFAIPLLLNNTFGPTCKCHMRTAVQTEELCPLNRLRRARRILNHLRPLILRAQGSMPSADIAAPAPNLASAGAGPEPAGVPPEPTAS